MIFGHPRVLWLALALLPLTAWFLWWTWRKRQEVIRQFVQNRYLTEISVGATAGIQKLRRVLLLVAVAFLLLALAKPQWGFAWEQASQRSRDIIIAIDTSRSMLAADTAPNRLTRAKLAALDLQKLAKYDRLGLIAFAGTAFLQCPLTLDDEAFRQSVQILDPSVIPQGGTAIGEAIEAARKAFEEDEVENHKILVLMTDGEDHEEKALEVAKAAAQDGMRIFTIGVGSPAGELLQVRDESGKMVYVKDESGNVVKSRLNEGLLQQLATAGSGFYLPLQGGNPMEVLYQKGLAPLPTSDRSTKLMRKAKEQYFWPLSIGILLLMIEILLPDRKRTARTAAANGATALPAAAAILIMLLSVAAAQASPASAQKKYQAKEFKGSLADYEELIKKTPTDARLRYNAGAAAYQAKKYEQALEQFQGAAAAPDLNLQQLAYYNLANTEYRIGEANSDPKERMASWQQAVQHYDAAIKLNTNDMDAHFNRELVQKKLEELKQQQQAQSKDKNSQDQSDDKQEQKDKQDQKKDQEKKTPEEQKDSEKKDQNSQQQQAQNQQQQQQQQSQEQKDKEQQQASAGKDEKKEEGEKKEGSQGGQQGEEEKPDEAAQQAQYAKLGQMSPAQARQLLDAQKGEEKALIFVPNQPKKRSPNDRSFKDW